MSSLDVIEVEPLKDAPSSRQHSRSNSPGNIVVPPSSGRTSPANVPVKGNNARRNSRDMIKRPSYFVGPRTPMSAHSNMSAPRMSVAPAKKAPPVRRKGKEPVGNFLLGDQLGRGQFGVVHRGVNSENGEFVAIKQMKSEKINEQALQAFEAEIKLLENLHHENIVQYLKCVRTSNHINLVIEYCDGGSLTDLLKKFGSFPERLCAVYISQTLRGLEYLHSKQVVHRDIKGANILLTKTGSVKLADFGISMSANSTDIVEPGVGSPYWMAPEVIQMEDIITVKADIWSLGSTAVELVTGKPPYSEYHPMGAILRCAKDDHPPLPANISPELQDFLLRCFQKDIDQRATATELQSHPWFTSSKQTDDASKDATQQVTGEVKPVASRSIRVYGQTIRPDSTFKTCFLTASTTCTEVLAVVLKKYGIQRGNFEMYALFEERDNGEIHMLGDLEIPLVIAERWTQAQGNFHFSVRVRPPDERRRVGMVQRKETVRKAFGRREKYIPRMFIVDSEEKYISFLETEDSSEYEKPMQVLYDLRMVKEVLQINNDSANKIFEFSLNDRIGHEHVLRVNSSAEMTAWICIIQEACGIFSNGSKSNTEAAQSQAAAAVAATVKMATAAS